MPCSTQGGGAIDNTLFTTYTIFIMDLKEFSRFEALYNLARNNPDINEVRNASVLIVKMIEKFNIITTIRNTVSNNPSTYTPPSYSPPQNSNTSSSTYREKQDDYVRRQREASYSSTESKYIHLSFKHLCNYTVQPLLRRVEDTVDCVVDFLEQKAVLNKHKDLKISVAAIVELALKDGLINITEAAKYTSAVRVYLNIEVNHGVLIGVPGRSGGFKLK